MTPSVATPYPDGKTPNVTRLRHTELLQWQEIEGGGILLGHVDPPGLITRDDAIEFAHQIIIGYAKMTDPGIEVAALHYIEEIRRQRSQDVRHLYLIESAGYHKIGISKNPIKRLTELEKQSPFPMRILHTVATGAYRELEYLLHTHYSHQHHHGEWFRLSETDIAVLVLHMDDHAEPPQ